MGQLLVLPIGENNPDVVTGVQMHTTGLDATSGAAVKAAIDTLVLGEIRDGYLRTETVVATEAATAGAVPSTAHRGEKWKVVFTTTNGEFYFTIPTANKSLASAGSDLLDTSAGVGKALFDALNTFIQDEYGAAGTINYIKYINLPS